jgi:hypothetical protein
MPRTDRASRVIAAPADRVWAALTDPEALLAWLPPGEMTGRFDRFDARPGGSYRLVLTYAGTMTMTWAVTPVSAGTLADIVAEDVPDGISAEDHAAGLSSSLANLAAYVER